MKIADFLRRYLRMPPGFRIVSSFIFLTVALSGFLFLASALYQYRAPSKQVLGAVAANSFSENIQILLLDRFDIYLYIGAPLLITVIILMIWLIRKSIRPKVPKAPEEEKDELI